LSVKRLLDFSLASVALVVLSPLMGVIALLVRIDSAGPALFRQERVGRGGRTFAILKFRSMRADAPLRGPALTVGDDPRITRIGRFIRRHKLDELPQLMNVIKGDMSLVGPRPEVPRYVDLYPEEIRSVVLSVRPGITDPASVAFVNESELLATAANAETMYRDVILPQKLRMYCEYVAGQSVAGDLKVLFGTVVPALRNRPPPLRGREGRNP
jgi:lipopolysaccharide/colanic/teichoic acid biosynthesis glycosyltransferase